jgi:glycosyltransferase involved in cell wall biosynthesis
MTSERPKRRVLQIVADGAPGGGTTAVLGLCDDLLATRNWDIHLITARDSYAAEQASNRGVGVHGIVFPASRFDLSLPGKLQRLVQEIRPDLIHVHGARSAHQFSLPPLKNRPYTLIYTVHGYHFPVKPQPLRFLGQVAEKKIAHRVNHVCFVSKADSDIAARLGIIGPGVRHSLIYNGINPDEFTAHESADKTHDLVFVGRMVRQKNPEFVIDVLEKLKGESVKLLMVGGGELEPLVRQRAVALGVDGLITFTGKLARADAIAALCRARLFVFPSRWEGLPIGPMEAMHCGVPVVGSNVGGTGEVVSSGKDGILIDGFDPQIYAEQILRLLRDDRLRQAYIDSGKRKVREEFLRSASSGKYMALYDQLCPVTVEQLEEYQ